MSVFEAIKAAAWHNDCNIDIEWVDGAGFDANAAVVADKLQDYDGVLVPGGFGQRALEGKIRAAQYALTNKVPYLGLCLGLQMAVVAAARNSGLQHATSEELDSASKTQVISTMADQKGKHSTGGTMRLGDYASKLQKGSLAARVYGTTEIVERHRHRYECNNDYRELYESWGIVASGLSPDGNLVEMIEAIDHPFFLATQAHPEFKSRPHRPHPMFDGFIKSML
jgi:CTP synthase